MAIRSVKFAALSLYMAASAIEKECVLLQHRQVVASSQPHGDEVESRVQYIQQLSGEIGIRSNDIQALAAEIPAEAGALGLGQTPAALAEIRSIAAATAAGGSGPPSLEDQVAEVLVIIRFIATELGSTYRALDSWTTLDDLRIHDLLAGINNMADEIESIVDAAQLTPPPAGASPANVQVLVDSIHWLASDIEFFSDEVRDSTDIIQSVVGGAGGGGGATNSGFVVVTSGTCQSNGLEPISNNDDCASAAEALGFSITWGPHGGYPDVIEGCSVRGGSMLFIQPSPFPDCVENTIPGSCSCAESPNACLCSLGDGDGRRGGGGGDGRRGGGGGGDSRGGGGATDSGFLVVTSGTCQSNGLEPISNNDDCASAAEALGFSITWGPHGGYPDVIEGCSVRGGSMLFIQPSPFPDCVENTIPGSCSCAESPNACLCSLGDGGGRRGGGGGGDSRRGSLVGIHSIVAAAAGHPELPTNPVERLHFLREGLHYMSDQLHFLLADQGLTDRLLACLDTLRVQADDITSDLVCGSECAESSMSELDELVNGIHHTADGIGMMSAEIHPLAEEIRYAVAEAGAEGVHQTRAALAEIESIAASAGATGSKQNPGESPSDELMRLCDILDFLASEMVPVLVVRSDGEGSRRRAGGPKAAGRLQDRIWEIVADFRNSADAIIGARLTPPPPASTARVADLVQIVHWIAGDIQMMSDGLHPMVDRIPQLIAAGAQTPHALAGIHSMVVSAGTRTDPNSVSPSVGPSVGPEAICERAWELVSGFNYIGRDLQFFLEMQENPAQEPEYASLHTRLDRLFDCIGELGLFLDCLPPP